MCYRPAVFFHQIRLTTLSLPQGKIQRAFKNAFFFFVFPSLLSRAGFKLRYYE
jgi:hypothetical protein